MHFDPTIRLDMVVPFLGLIWFVARTLSKLQAQMTANTQEIGRVAKLVGELETRQRTSELDIARHLGASDRPAAGGGLP